MSFGDQWRNAQNTSDFKPPKGPYKVRITEGNADYSQAGDPKAKLVLEIVDGDEAGRKFEHFMWMGNDAAQARHKEALLGYGLNDKDIEDITDLDDRIQDLIGTTAEIGVSYGGDEGQYLNINVHRSWPPEPQSDIPTDTKSFDTRTEEQKSFAAAAAEKFGDEPNF